MELTTEIEEAPAGERGQNLGEWVSRLIDRSVKMENVTADTWRLGHRPGLDQLRGLAVLGVFVAHTLYGLPVMWAGAVGVAVFFTLSGFLITRLMVEELDRTGRLDLRAFYERRARRLLPVLPLALGLCLVANVAVGEAWRQPLVAALTYTSNWDAVDGTGGTFRHLWSLAVEEHFYGVWPAVVFFIRDRRRLTWIAGAVVVLAGAGRAVEAFSDPEFAYRATHLRLDGMLAGALLAMHLHRITVPRWAGRAGWVVLGVLCLDVVPQAAAQGWGLSVLSVATCAVIPGAMIARRRRWLERVGVISYGLYLFHYPITRLVRLYTTDDLAVFLIGGALTFAMAELSYRLIESPWRLRVPVRLELRPDDQRGGGAIRNALRPLQDHVAAGRGGHVGAHGYDVRFAGDQPERH